MNLPAILSNPLSENEIYLILVSIFIGLIIGIEREYFNKSAGLRTFILVSFGSCVFTILSIKIGLSNPDRLAANIITGIGFLGAGVIFKEDNKIAGVTTATTIWATSSLGMAVGSGHIYLAILGAFMVMLTLRLLIYLQYFIDNFHKIRVYRIATTSEENFEYCKKIFIDNNLQFELIKEQYNPDNLICYWQVTGKSNNHVALIKVMRNNNKINSYQY
ncbi:MAG: hypothetical protein RJA25_256 [Bacteroidota bacterium]|jgi:putative Mg2+ transporter-C (MgtC) family protein